MKKCRGCGIELQNEDNTKTGYIAKPGQDYCQRCFRLRNYNDHHNLYGKSVRNNEILKMINEENINDLALVLDILDFLFIDHHDLLNNFKKQNIILVLNKLDILPKNISEDNFLKLMEDKINLLRKDFPNIKECLLTSIHDDKFKEFFFETLDDLKIKKLLFIGKTNAGKSSILNKLIEDNTLTVSPFIGTTLSLNEINIREYTLIDSPGLLDNNSILNYLPLEKVKDVLPHKTLNAKNYQFYEDQSYYIEGLLRIDVKTNDKGSITFYLNDNLNIHRTKLDNSDRYYERNKKDIKYKVDLNERYYLNNKEDKMIYISGLGIIKLSGLSNYVIYHYDKIGLYISEVLF